MAQSSSRSQIQTPKHLQGTHDDPAKTFVLYEGVRSSDGIGPTFCAKVVPISKGRLELSIRQHYDEDKTLTDLYAAARIDEAHSIELIVKGTKFLFTSRVLRKSSSNLPEIREIHRTPPTEDASPSNRIALEEVQKAIDQFSKTDDKYALSVMRLFEMYTKVGIYGTKEFVSKQGYYDFEFQVACLRFARVIQDDAFEYLAVTEMFEVWCKTDIKGGTGLNLTQLGVAFSMAPTLDKLLIGYRVKGQKEQDGIFRVYQISKKAHVQSWKALLLRWDERQLVRSEKIEQLARETRASVEPISPPSA